MRLIRGKDCLRFYPVSTLVNKVQNKSEECIKPIDLRYAWFTRTLFLVFRSRRAESRRPYEVMYVSSSSSKKWRRLPFPTVLTPTPPSLCCTGCKMNGPTLSRSLASRPFLAALFARTLSAPLRILGMTSGRHVTSADLVAYKHPCSPKELLQRRRKFTHRC